MKNDTKSRNANPDQRTVWIYNHVHQAFNPGFTELGNAYPNPFRSFVTIPVLVHEANRPIVINVSNNKGKLVARLKKSFEAPGLHHFEWNGMGINGKEVPAGLLYYKLVNCDCCNTYRLLKN